MTPYRTDFALASVEAWHLVVPEATYWRTYREDNRAATSRFLLKPGWRTVYARRVESALVRVTLVDGSVGWGEATEPICPEVICRLVVELLGPLAGGVEFATPLDLWDYCYDLNRGRGHVNGYQQLAIAALDMAVWDALARRADVPLCAMLAPDPVRSLGVYLSGLRRSTRPERTGLLRRMTDEGLRGAKIFVGGDTAQTVQEASALRDEVPGDWRLMVDALWSYTEVDAAAEAKQALVARDVDWLECPLVPEDLPGHAALVSRPGVPIALGESFHTAWQVRPWTTARALDILQPDIGRTGFSDGLRQHAIAQAAGIGVTAHMGSGTPVVQAAALHFNAGFAGDRLAECQFDLGAVLPEVFDTGWRYRAGQMAVPQRSGLGVEVNADLLASHCESIERWSLGNR
jgi:galactonate dehydratase